MNETTTTAAAEIRVEGLLAHLSLLLLLIPALTIFGNILVVLSVFRERSLQSVTNYLIVSLATADFLVALFVMPFAIYMQMHDLKWTLGLWMCNMWIFCDVAASTASILNLVAISFDRYLAITHPIQYSKHGKNFKRAFYLIVIVWVLSFAIALPLPLGVNNIQEAEFEKTLECQYTDALFIIGSSLCSFFIPCVFMSAMYMVILKRLRDRQKFKRKGVGPGGAGGNRGKAARKGLTVPGDRASSERISAALFGGAQLAREMGKRLRDRSIADDMMASSTMKDESSSDEDETTSTLSPHGRGHSSTSPMTLSPTAEFNTNTGVSSLARPATVDEPTSSSVATDSYRYATDGTTSPQNKGVLPDGQSKGTEDQQSGSITNRSFGEELMEIFPYIDSRSRECSAKQNHRPTHRHHSHSHHLNNPHVHTRTSKSVSAAPIVHPDSIENFGSLREHPRHIIVVNSATPPVVGTPHPPAVGDMKLATINETKQPQNRRPGRYRSESPAELIARSVDRARHGLMKRIADFRLVSFKPHTRRMEKEAKKRIRKERKATVTLAVVLAVFLICWVPFFTLHLSNALCIQFGGAPCIKYLPFLLTTWLGYMNSFMNPIIYTIFNPEYRRAFMRILNCKHAHQR